MTYDEETEIYKQCAERLRARGFHILAKLVEEIANMDEQDAKDETDRWKEIEL